MKLLIPLCIVSIIATCIHADSMMVNVPEMFMHSTKEEKSERTTNPNTASLINVVLDSCYDVKYYAMDTLGKYLYGSMNITVHVNGSEIAPIIDLLPIYDPMMGGNYFYAVFGNYSECTWINLTVEAVCSDQFTTEFFTAYVQTTCPCVCCDECCDPHLLTHDGKRLNYQGKCGEVLTTNDCVNEGPGTFTICGLNSGGMEDEEIRHVIGTYIVSGSNEILVGGPLTQLNGKDISRYAFTVTPDKSIVMFMFMGKYLIYHLVENWYVLFSPHNVEVELHSKAHLRGHVCGMLGNADGDSTNDMQLPNGTITTDHNVLGAAWQCPNGCEARAKIPQHARNHHY
ncbi:von Willebrand factor-like [Saccoglossus kowalevskii]|uniref:SCO-spondin-like n=1 Tax=Saccoglossus kowalevskii TaxID=10224 RepID=A0ABM0MFY4_SACKO|nr:PREDICTED: SCO-spondin-like [Saccoglossus kowalevskii]